ncbi:MAG: PaaI family thioesterase [Sedimentisphaerales bacterium]|nr:PaaI family thioesterase [Sedimentisphaerales bacterium]
MADQIRIGIRQRVHPHCIGCSPDNPQGLHLRFEACPDGSVQASFCLGRSHESYPGILHGGVLSLILDSAMTSCLFAREIVAVTADFQMRLRHPVLVDRAATVRAWIDYVSEPIYLLKGEITQNQQRTTTATGKFLERPHWPPDWPNRAPP